MLLRFHSRKFQRFGGCCNRYFWDMRPKIYRIPNFWISSFSSNIISPKANSPFSSSLWPLNWRSEDAFFKALASIWSNVFTNSIEKKTCLLLFLLCIQLFRESLSGKVHATILKGIVGGFEFSFFQRNLKELARKVVEMCLRVLQESNKSWFDSYSRQEQCTDHIPYYLSVLSRVHFFRQPFSK